MPRESLVDVWPHVEHLIESALPRGCGRVTKRECYQGVETGTFLMWVIGRDGEIVATALSEVLAFSQKRVLSVFLYAGERRRVQHLWPIVEDVAKACDCQEVQIAGSRAWARLVTQFAPGFSEAFTVYTKEVG